MVIKRRLILVSMAAAMMLSGCSDKTDDDRSSSANSVSSLVSSANTKTAASEKSVSSLASSANSKTAASEKEDIFKTSPAPLPEEWTESDDIAAINIAINDAAYEISIDDLGDMITDEITVGSVVCLDTECLEVRFSTDATNFYYVLRFGELGKMNEKAVVVRDILAKRYGDTHGDPQESDRHYDAAEVYAPFPEHISREEAEKIAFSDAGLDTSKSMFGQVEGPVGIDTDSRLAPTYYEIRFSTKENTFKYKIDASTGEILEKNAE